MKEEILFKEFTASNDYTKKALVNLFGGSRVIDLLFHIPFEYRSLSVLSGQKLEIPENTEAVLDILVLSHEPSFKISAKNPYKIRAELTDGNELIISFFAGNVQMWKSIFKENIRYKISCKIQKFSGIYYTSHPKILNKSEVQKINEEGLLTAKYPLTGNITQAVLKSIMEKHLKLLAHLPEMSFHQEKLMPFFEAIYKIHIPTSLKEAENARTRLAFDEILAKNLAFMMANLKAEKEFSPKIAVHQTTLSNILKVLPFILTEDQQVALEKVLSLQAEEKQNSVLLQGDVGSGKTIVSILASINIVMAGFQVAVMSPTYILAKQTLEAFSEIVKVFNIEILFFSGEDKGKKRLAKLREIKEGRAKIVIGTHALFSADVEFYNLGYAVIDEQHRFGINQRLALSAKAKGVKTLLMTATPIPRTLSMALFGDIEVSYIKNKPKNRKEIITKLFLSEKIPEIIEAIKRKINEGEQIYWVVPLIEDAEDGKKQNGISIEERKRLLEEHFGDKLTTIHGKMKDEEISQEMEKFKAGLKSIMLATTVIEVGVNVPNATLMVVESAENFGLSTLHQLRGRVGRGALQSYCFLISGSRAEAILARLKIIVNSTDGFFIAEKDMELRGSGAIFSKMQSGFEGFKFAKTNEDGELFQKARKLAREIFAKNPNLEGEINYLMRFYNYDTLINYFKI